MSVVNARWEGRALLLGLVLLVGCGARAPRGEVEGKVVYGGRPLANVLVTFVPDTDRGNTFRGKAEARTDSEGRYSLQADDKRPGVPVGAYRVTVEDLAVYAVPRGADGELLAKPKVRFPPRFTDALQTPLRKEVQSGQQVIDLDLTVNP